MNDKIKNAERIISCLDVTLLENKAKNLIVTDNDIVDLCNKSLSSPVLPAAVCVDLAYASLAKNQLAGSGIKVATVVNFSSGAKEDNAVMQEIEKAILSKVDEIDYVLNWQQFIKNGGREKAEDQLKKVAERIKELSSKQCKLKVIIESGELSKIPEKVYEAALTAIKYGSDFVKTSTGFTANGASPKASKEILKAITDSKKICGIKISGGVKDYQSAHQYLSQAEESFAKSNVKLNKDNFRIGASSLFDHLIEILP